MLNSSKYLHESKNGKALNYIPRCKLKKKFWFYLEPMIFSKKFVRFFLNLPNYRTSTRGLKTHKNTGSRRFRLFKFLLEQKQPHKSMIFSEFFNTVWFVFFPKEWWVTYFHNRKMLGKYHKSNIKFKHLDTLLHRIITRGSRISKIKKNQRKRKTTTNEFNMGFKFLATLKRRYRVIF